MTDSKATAGKGNAAFAFLDQTHREIEAKLLRLKALAVAMRAPWSTAKHVIHTCTIKLCCIA